MLQEISLFPVLLSLKVASFSTLAALVLGVGAARLLARKRSAASSVLDVLCTLPMVLPPTVLGYYLILLFGRSGLLGPAISSLSGMPPIAMLPSMMVECAAYGTVTGLMMKFVRTKNAVADLYISMVTAMILGRVIAGLAKALIFAPGTPAFAWVTTSLVTGIPGIVIQLVVMPAVVFALTKARLISVRYPKESIHE